MRKILKKKDRSEILDGKILLRCSLKEEQRYKINQVRGFDLPEELRQALKTLNDEAESEDERTPEAC